MLPCFQLHTRKGDFAGARVVSHDFSYLIQCNSHFYQAEMYFFNVLYSDAVVLKIIIASNLSACALWSS